jgi:hypothetical protein
MWWQILSIIGAVVLIWFLIGYIRRNPQAFSKENLNRSFFTLGILALFLIAVVAICVILVRQ